jgi:hypothetical protein
MSITAGSVVIAPDGSETKSDLAEVIYDAFVNAYLADTRVSVPGLARLQVPVKQQYAVLGTRLAQSLIGYFHANLFTVEQGLLVSLINKTGAASVKGSVVETTSGTDGAFRLQTTRDESFGIVYESGIADGSPCRVVVAGIADVLLEDGAGANSGDWIGGAATNGRAYSNGISPPAAAAHFDEIGHCLQTVAGGTDVLCRIVMHYN